MFVKIDQHVSSKLGHHPELYIKYHLISLQQFQVSTLVWTYHFQLNLTFLLETVSL